jgi:DNA-binding response OmpR family regulator
VKPFSLVILDFQMPYKNGIQVIQEVRAHYDQVQTRCPTLKLVQPKFVINSAFKTKGLTLYLRSNDIDDCLEKPIPLDRLREMVRLQTM